MADFNEYWSDLRRGFKREDTPNSEDIVSRAVLHRWAQDTDNKDRPPFVVVSGTNRDILYKQVQSEELLFAKPGGILDLHGPTTTSWVYGVTKHLAARVRDLRIPREFCTPLTVPLPTDADVGCEILWALIAAPYLAVDDPLDQLIDQRFSLLSDAHRGLLEARFALREDADFPIASVVQALGAWVSGEKHSTLTVEQQEFLSRARITQSVTDPERAELLHFLLTLARQNGILDSVVIAIDGLENLVVRDVADELYRYLDVTARWLQYGSPLGLIIGWRGAKEDARSLKKLHPKLARRVTDADRWIRILSSEG